MMLATTERAPPISYLSSTKNDGELVHESSNQSSQSPCKSDKVQLHNMIPQKRSEFRHISVAKKRWDEGRALREKPILPFHHTSTTQKGDVGGVGGVARTEKNAPVFGSGDSSAFTFGTTGGSSDGGNASVGGDASVGGFAALSNSSTKSTFSFSPKNSFGANTNVAGMSMFGGSKNAFSTMTTETIKISPFGAFATNSTTVRSGMDPKMVKPISKVNEASSLDNISPSKFGKKELTFFRSESKSASPSSSSSAGSLNLNRLNEDRGWGDTFSVEAGSWRCEFCYVRNKAEDTKCVSCICVRNSHNIYISPTLSRATTPSGSRYIGDLSETQGSWRSPSQSPIKIDGRRHYFVDNESREDGSLHCRT